MIYVWWYMWCNSGLCHIVSTQKILFSILLNDFFFWNRNNIFIDLQKKISLCFQFNHNVLTPQSKGKHTRSKTLGSSLKVSPSHCSLTALWLACLSCVIALINLSWQASDHWGPKLLIWYNLNPHSIHTLSLIIAVTVQSNQMLRPLQ